MLNLWRWLRFFAVACILSAASAPLAASPEQVQGHVVLARAGKNAVVMWDATTDVVAIVQGKVTEPAANEKLERDALNALATKVPALKASETVNIQIAYQKIGAVSPIYGSATFAGIEVYATITMKAKDAIDDRDKWTALRADSPIPAWVELKIVGKLPPR